MPESPRHAATDAAVAACFDVMAELRPRIARAEFVPRVREMEGQGYRLASLAHEGRVVCVAGYRVASNFHLGRHLYVDDLVTAQAYRGKGLGRQMLDWLRAEARALGCDYLHLDSGTQRLDAHRFYFCHGMTIGAFHFYERLDDS
jgi:GNAT superfamily N-acetyltransferase